MIRHVALFLGVFLLVPVGQYRAQLPMSSWISVKDFGAKGDAKTDDSLAIIKAIKYADNFGGVVYFPTAPGYVFDGQLPVLSDGTRVTLFLDSQLVLTGTLKVLTGYVIRGNSGGPLTAFSTDSLASISVGPGASPAISIHRQTGVRLENLSVQYVNYGSDGIVVDGSSSEIVFKNVFVHMHGDSVSGIPLLIRGGFGYTVEGGGYGSPWSSSSPSIEFSDDAACNYVGIFRVRHAFLAGHGINITSACGGVNSMTFEDVLFESAASPFLTINSHSSLGVWSISLKDINMADSVGDPKPPLIEAHCQCAGIWGVQVVNSYTDGPQLTTGDPISDLEVWSPFPNTGYKIAQASGYVLHTPSGIYNAMPVFQVNGASDFSINPSSQPAQTIQSGQTATYPLIVKAGPGFKQTVEFACSGQPAESICTVAPSSIALSGSNSASVIVDVATTARAHLQPGRTRVGIPSQQPLAVLLACTAFILLMMIFNRRKSVRPTCARGLSLCTVLCTALLISSCARMEANGNIDSARGAGTPKANSGTAEGTYTLSIVARCKSCSNNLTHETSLILVVK